MNHYGDWKNFKELFLKIRYDLVMQPTVNVGEWQSQHDPSKFLMKELLHTSFGYELPADAAGLGEATGARLPWAEDHFQERVGGEPLNPAPSEAWWPFRQKKNGNTNTDHKSEGEAFSHTYPERMWPKYAGGGDLSGGQNIGIRFELGDLNDVVRHLIDHPFTRQAYLPIWFPEDGTALRRGKRVPCTLGYHFIIRDGKLDISYFMRSTDLLRHFQDDVYMAGRLAQWVVDRINQAYGPIDPENAPFSINPLEVGSLIFHTANMHIFEGDLDMIRFMESQGKVWY